MRVINLYVKKVCNSKKFLKNFFDHFWEIISHTEYHQYLISSILDFLISISGLVDPRTHFFLVGRYFIEFSLWICSSVTTTPPARCSRVQYFLCSNTLLSQNERHSSLVITHIKQNSNYLFHSLSMMLSDFIS